MPEERDSTAQPRQKLHILIVENDPAAVHLTKEAFREAGMEDVIMSVPDGEEALAYLRRKEKYSQHPNPDLIFLDLHLPKKSGLEVLSEIKQHPRLKLTPVVVVSGSANPKEIQKAYELHASCYIRKPDDLYDFLLFIKICYDFWGTVVTLPGNAEPELAGVH
jgi:CheY-like chemotaxis protein